MTPKQERFIQEYLVDSNATQAAIRAGCDILACDRPLGYYVYLLTDSRTNEIFYVGKGKGRRYLAHVREWASMRFQNEPKCQRIGDIIRDAGSVVALCFSANMDEPSAFILERKLIAALGPKRLTNLAHGQFTEYERAMLYAAELLARMKPFSLWNRESHRTSRDCEDYWFVLNGLHTVATRIYA